MENSPKAQNSLVSSAKGATVMMRYPPTGFRYRLMATVLLADECPPYIALLLSIIEDESRIMKKRPLAIVRILLLFPKTTQWKVFGKAPTSLSCFLVEFTFLFHTIHLCFLLVLVVTLSRSVALLPAAFKGPLPAFLYELPRELRT